MFTGAVTAAAFQSPGKNQKEQDSDKEKMNSPSQDPRRDANFSAAALRK